MYAMCQSLCLSEGSLHFIHRSVVEDVRFNLSLARLNSDNSLCLLLPPPLPRSLPAHPCPPSEDRFLSDLGLQEAVQHPMQRGTAQRACLYQPHRVDGPLEGGHQPRTHR